MLFLNILRIGSYSWQLLNQCNTSKYSLKIQEILCCLLVWWRRYDFNVRV